MQLKSAVVAAVVAFALLVGAGSGAKAIVYTFNNVALSDGGVLNGTLGIQFGGIIGYNLTTTGGNSGLDTVYTFPGFPNPNANPFGSPTVVQLFPNIPASDLFVSTLTLAFSDNLMSAGSHILLGGANGPSFECSGSFSCAAGLAGSYPIRWVADNTEINSAGSNVSQAPLPAALPLFASGVAGMWLFARFKKRRSSGAGV